MEHNLLGVGQQLCVPAEVLHGVELTGHLDSHECSREEQEWRDSHEEGGAETNKSVVSELALSDVLGSRRLVKMNTVLMSEDSRETRVVISLFASGEVTSHLPDKGVLKTKIGGVSYLMKTYSGLLPK